MKKLLLTIDVEQDIPSKLNGSYKGIESLPQLLDLLKKMDIKASFFTTADVCIKYPEIMERIVTEEHQIGCHGYSHKELWFKTYKQQLKEIRKSTEVINNLLGIKPKIFRAPRFSVNEKTIRVLEELGYEIDSSVLPNNIVKELRGLITFHSHIGAHKVPYYPSSKNILEDGDTSVLEVPITENPMIKGAPIGAGFLNKYGIAKTFEVINEVKEEYLIFLIHPWELVDLSKYYPELDRWVLEICSENLNLYEDLFQLIQKSHLFCRFEDVFQKHKSFCVK
jgi:peptidoglycan/xylan/chitin deacetylase (PgdA/CDA1 family)